MLEAIQNNRIARISSIKNRLEEEARLCFIILPPHLQHRGEVQLYPPFYYH